MTRARLDPAIFHLPVERMRAGYYSDKYFVRARDVLRKDHHRPSVTMQVFSKARAFLGGIDLGAHCYPQALQRGGGTSWRCMRSTTGMASSPGRRCCLSRDRTTRSRDLENVVPRGYPGTALRTRVGTNTRLVVEAARPKEVMFFPARHDHWLVQTGDGYAAHIAGAIGVSTDAQASWWGSEGVGTVPHALIAAYGGDTVRASRKFADTMSPDVRLVTLVDFENDCVGTSLRVARALGERLNGVRLDTAETLVDRSVVPEMGTFKPTGVNPQLVANVRTALDQAGFSAVKIVVSGGFTVEKIRRFEELGVAADVYGVGSSLFQGRFDFTADVVRVEGQPCAKVGRSYRPNPRLARVD